MNHFKFIISTYFLLFQHIALNILFQQHIEKNFSILINKFISNLNYCNDFWTYKIEKKIYYICSKLLMII